MSDTKNNDKEAKASAAKGAAAPATDNQTPAEVVLVACTVAAPTDGRRSVTIGSMVVAPGKRLKLPAAEVKALVELGVVTAG